jgi:TolB-like protein
VGPQQTVTPVATSEASGIAEQAPLDRYRIAVLPFANISADPEDEYFSDGMPEELISKLSRLRDLTVIARTSIMQYKETGKSIAEIGRELQVGTILEGSVRKAGDRLRITAQLVLLLVAERFQLHLLPDHAVEIEALNTLRPRFGLPMVLTRI